MAAMSSRGNASSSFETGRDGRPGAFLGLHCWGWWEPQYLLSRGQWQHLTGANSTQKQPGNYYTFFYCWDCPQSYTHTYPHTSSVLLDFWRTLLTLNCDVNMTDVTTDMDQNKFKAHREWLVVSDMELVSEPGTCWWDPVHHLAPGPELSSTTSQLTSQGVRWVWQGPQMEFTVFLWIIYFFC